MTNRKSTKRALLGSVMAMVLCMLVGATFAWFTDTASTGVNKIQAGNLDVALEYSTDFKTWNKVTDTTKLFEDSTVWEPGRTEVVYLRVKNAGTLALKYTVGMYNINEGRGKNVAGEYYYLSDYVKLGAVETTAAYADREAAINAVNAEAKTLKSIGSSAIIGEDQMVMLAPEADAKTYALVLYMPTEVGNEANPKNNDPYWASKFSFGISVNATQAEYENDSYDNTYDHDAPELFSAESFLMARMKSPRIFRPTADMVQCRLKRQRRLRSTPMCTPCIPRVRTDRMQPWPLKPVAPVRLSSKAVTSVRLTFRQTIPFAI